jgi:phosphorylcholine metabolism protein LicD
MPKLSYERRALEAEDAYCDAMYNLANDIRNEVIVPFCDKHGLSFRSGMGTWILEGHGKVYASWDEDVHRFMPKKLYEALTIPWHLGARQDLGALIQDYTPANYKE